jgi:hypothetical protein
MPIILPALKSQRGQTNNGVYKIVGTVTGVDSSRLVRLHDRVTGRELRQAWSVNGTIQFRYLSYDEYCGYAIDHTNVWNLAAVDRCVLTPE